MERYRVTLRGTMIAFALIAAVTLLASCGSSPEQSGVDASPSVSPSWTGPPISAAAAAAVRERAFDYWEAYNAYDPELAITYLDEAYRPSQEEVVRDEIGRIKTFGVQLGMSEKTAPVLIGPEQSEMYLSMKTPTGVRTILMRFATRDDVWMITFVEEVQ